MASGTKKSTVKKKSKKAKTSTSSKKSKAPKKKKAKKAKKKKYNATDMVNDIGKMIEPIETPKIKTGRPSSFKPEYSQMLIDHMKEGYNFESFAAKLNYQSVGGLYRWIDLHDEFREAKRVGEAMSLLWWLRLARAGATGQIKNFNATVWIFTMKNMFGWRDKHDIKTENKEVREVIHQVEIGMDGDISRHRLEIE